MVQVWISNKALVDGAFEEEQEDSTNNKMTRDQTEYIQGHSSMTSSETTKSMLHQSTGGLQANQINIIKLNYRVQPIVNVTPKHTLGQMSPVFLAASIKFTEDDISRDRG